MLSQKYIHFLRRLKEMGPATAIFLGYNRLKKKSFIRKSKARWLQGHSYHTWNEIARLHKTSSFENYLEKLKTQTWCENILNDPLFQETLPPALSQVNFTNKTNPELNKLAEHAAIPSVNILGHGSFCFAENIIPWHTDFATTKPSPTKWKTEFYSDIPIPNSHQNSLQQALDVDIKTPWELSRFQHLFPLALGYRQAKCNQQQEICNHYAQAFEKQVNNWIEKNPFLQGVNWLNPMEVAIRSINLIWAFHFFKNAPNIKLSFWQKFICTLHDHALFLSCNWEVSDKPNNHYLADLVGYLYLEVFLMPSSHRSLLDIKIHYQTRASSIKKIIKQLDNQILLDGICYEGSTSYHKLVTEMLLHTVLICKHTPINLPAQIIERYNIMKQFIQDCTDNNGNFVQIGDNDGGKILAGIHIPISRPPLETKQSSIITYKNFGLSIIKTKRWHITFRHPTYQTHQPTGHFHQDALSFTLSFDDMPIIVDPGTYVYTAHKTFRNHFRSTSSHNTFFLQNYQPKHPEDLFQLTRTPHPQASTAQQSQGVINIQDQHQIYKPYELWAHRKLSFDQQQLTITDWFSQQNSKKQSPQIEWNLNFTPEIKIEKQNAKTWLIKKK